MDRNFPGPCQDETVFYSALDNPPFSTISVTASCNLTAQLEMKYPDDNGYYEYCQNAVAQQSSTCNLSGSLTFTAVAFDEQHILSNGATLPVNTFMWFVATIGCCGTSTPSYVTNFQQETVPNQVYTTSASVTGSSNSATNGSGTGTCPVYMTIQLAFNAGISDLTLVGTYQASAIIYSVANCQYPIPGLPVSCGSGGTSLGQTTFPQAPGSGFVSPFETTPGAFKGSYSFSGSYSVAPSTCFPGVPCTQSGTQAYNVVISIS